MIGKDLESIIGTFRKIEKYLWYFWRNRKVLYNNQTEMILGPLEFGIGSTKF